MITTPEQLTAEIELRRSFARRPRVAEQPIRSAIARLLERRGLTTEAAEGDLPAAVAQAVGERFAKLVSAKLPQRGVLTLVVASSAVSQELSFSKAKLLATIQQACPTAEIRSLRITVGTVTPPAPEAFDE